MVQFFFWHIVCLCLFYLMGYANKMPYNFALFANLAFAAWFSVGIVYVVFTLIPQSSDKKLLQRMQSRIAAAFATLQQSQEEARLEELESLAYSAIAKTEPMKDTVAKEAFYLFVGDILEKGTALVYEKQAEPYPV